MYLLRVPAKCMREGWMLPDGGPGVPEEPFQNVSCSGTLLSDHRSGWPDLPSAIICHSGPRSVQSSVAELLQKSPVKARKPGGTSASLGVRS